MAPGVRGAVRRVFAQSQKRGSQTEGQVLTMALARETIARMSGYVPGEQPQDKRYIKLNTNENPYPPSPRVLETLHGLGESRLRLYPDPIGQELKQVASELCGLTPDWVLCGNGSDDLLTIAVRTFVDQGGTLACPHPSYSLYPVLSAIQGAQCVEIPLDGRFELSPDAVAQAAGATLLFVARPNAPTGNAFALEVMRRVCAEFDGVVWIDEAYVDFAEDDCLEFVREFANVVVSRTLSKSYSLASIRLGLAYANPELIGQMMKVKDSYNVNFVTQKLAVAALRDQDHMKANADRIRRTRAAVSDELAQLGCAVLPSQANFLLVAPPGDARDMVGQLRERGILVRYFRDDRVAKYFRVTIGTPAEMQAFTDAVRGILAQ